MAVTFDSIISGGHVFDFSRLHKDIKQYRFDIFKLPVRYSQELNVVVLAISVLNLVTYDNLPIVLICMTKAILPALKVLLPIVLY